MHLFLFENWLLKRQWPAVLKTENRPFLIDFHHQLVLDQDSVKQNKKWKLHQPLSLYDLLCLCEIWSTDETFTRDFFLLLFLSLFLVVTFLGFLLCF